MADVPWKIDDISGPAAGVPWKVDDVSDPSLLEQLKRQAGLTGRAAANIVTSPVQLGGNVLNKAINAIGGMVGHNPNLAMPSDIVDTQLNKVFPKPQGMIENVAQDIAKSAPAAMLPGALAAQAGGNALVSGALAKPGSEATDMAIGAAIPAAITGGGKVLKHTLGGMTGTGAMPIEQAVRAGRENIPEFAANMRGKVAPSAVVEQARAGLENMYRTTGKAYEAARPAWAEATEVVNFAPIEKRYQDLVDSTMYKGVSRLAPEDQRILAQIGGIMDEWRTRPELRTLEGLDALKQRIRNINPEAPQHTQSKRLIEGMARGVKDEISARSPKYAAAMEDYARRMADIDEVKRTLSLGDKASVDTALRKLQSLMRNNVNANFGQRVKTAEKLKTVGGEDVLPGVAGQAMSAVMPRGIQGALVGLGAPATAFLAPQTLPVLPLMSPYVVGEGAHALGKASQYVKPGTIPPTLAAMLRKLREEDNGD